MALEEEVSMELDEAATAPAHDGVPVYEPIVVAPPPENVGDFDHTGPRLMITHIENENFKSYAGKQSLGPFHKSFSAIVGPNGSGKSNVIDSMLFVFGFRAQQIRSKKISVLIHNSDGHHHINSCTVTVHFQKIDDTGAGDDDYDVVPNSKFTVSRTAFRDNSSYYKINDKKATYKEVGVLLRQQGIDLDHDRFLILQGEVERIAMMKSKAPNEHEDGMLEFLEDIIGSSRFKEPITQLAQRVENLNDLRGEKLNRVKAVEKEKDDLEGVKNEALEYLTIENDIVKEKNMLYQKYVCECGENEEKATKKRDEIQEGMKELNEKCAGIEERKKEQSKEMKKIHKKHGDLAKKCEETKATFSEYEQQDVRCREDLKHTKGKSKKLKKTLEQEQKKLEELKQIPDKTERDIGEFQKKLDKLEAEKAKEEEKLKEVMDSLKTETQGLQEEKDAKKKKVPTATLR